MSQELWRQCANWLKTLRVVDGKNACFDKGARVYDLALALQDGVALCNLANSIVPNIIDNVHMAPGKQFLKMQNINSFLEVASKWCGKSDLFTADELYYASDFPKVIQCLSAVSASKACATRGFAKFPASAASNTATGAGGEDMYQSLEDLVGQSISFQEAAQSSAAFGFDDDDDAEEEVYGSIMRTIAAGGGGGPMDGGEEDIYGAVMGGGMDFGGGDDEDIYQQATTEAGGLTTRDRVLQELKGTEERYVGVLKVIIEKFMRPMAANSKINKSDHKQIFSIVTDLLTIHDEFNKMILKQLSSKTGRKMSVPFLTMLPKMRVYGQFCCDVPKCMEILTGLLKNKAGAKILEDLKAASGQRFNLKDLMNVPMQRVLKYPLLLKELIKSTEEGHKDRPKLINAKAAVDNLAEVINKTKSDHDTLMGMIAGLTGYKGPPLQQFAPFVKDGDVMYKDCNSSDKQEKKLNMRYAFMLQSAIVLTQPHKAKYKYKSLCKLEPTMKTASVEFWKLPKDEQNSKFSFAWALKIGAEERYIFAAKTLPLKKKWMTQMNQLIEDLQGPKVAPSVGERKKPVVEDFTGPSSGGGGAKAPKKKPPPITASKGYEEWAPGGGPASPSPTVVEPEGAADMATEEQWFAGRLGRPKAEKLFVGTPDGTFLIRESDSRPGEYSLSVKYNNVIKHIKINRKGNMYDLAPDAKSFPSIQEMVDHFRTHSLNRHFPGMETTLATPFKVAKKNKASAMFGQSADTGPGVGRARSKFAYTARSPDELTFERGVELTILSMDDPTLDPGWWKGTLPNGQIGIFPANYVQRLG